MIKSPEFYKPFLQKLKIEHLNPMQEEMWASAQGDQNLILQSPTGSGKTLAFLLPLIAKINKDDDSVQALVITPTRELAMQIFSVCKAMGAAYRFELCYGGHSLKEERVNLSTKKPQVVIGTPGRLKDHLTRENLIIDDLNVLVFDEWDKSLEMGFQEDIKDIVHYPRGVNQYVLTSATGGIEVPEFISLNNPKRIDYVSKKESDDRLKKFMVRSPEKDKIDTLVRLMCDLGETSTLVFLNYREAVERVCNKLNYNDIDADYFHGGLDQKDREMKLLKFRNGSTRVLVTTDLSARGLDIPLVENVIHYQLPMTDDQFIHRNGRTARMTASGKAFLIVSDHEEAKEYLSEAIPDYIIDEDKGSPESTSFVTLEISKGKKDKINKVDVLGYLTKSCGLRGQNVGLIEIKPYKSYVAVTRSFLDQIIKTTKDKKLKGKSIRVKVI